MGTRLHIERNAALPALAWVADVPRDGGAPRIACGDAVETDESGITAGAWAGRFVDRQFAEAATSIGSALRLVGERLIVLAGTAGAAPLHRYVSRDRLVLSNSLALALARSGDELRLDYPFYPQDLYSYAMGPDRYRVEVPTRQGRLAVFYRSMTIARDGEARPLPIVLGRAFADFAQYRAMLVEETAAIFANAGDPARRFLYRPVTGISAGYDSPAAAVLAREAGCRDAFTFRQSTRGGGASDDSGEAIARCLEMDVEAFDTFAYRLRDDLPEIEFIAASFGGGNLYLASAESQLAGRVVVSGGGGDFLWNRDYGRRRRPAWPPFLGGYSVNELYLRLPALDLAMPAIGAARPAEIGRISRSPEMQPWTIGGDYDRPIARRIAEEAGVPRAAFGQRKRMVTPVYDSVTRRTMPIDAFLSARSMSEFDSWFESRRPIRRRYAFWHNLAVETYGRAIWSSRLSLLLERWNLRWPPCPTCIWNLRVPVRKNAFVFNWAVERLVADYRRKLGSSADGGSKA